MGAKATVITTYSAAIMAPCAIYFEVNFLFYIFLALYINYWNSSAPSIADMARSLAPIGIASVSA